MNKFEYKNLTPFKWFVLENFPFIEADFDALTEWQLFCKIGKEMNKIINSENTIGTQMENVTNAFIDLQNYVNNYFDNLDVQDEINNKLNEMAEDGTLQEIISSYLNSKAIFGFDNVESMKNSSNLINGSYAKTLGFYNINDGGEAVYKIREIINTDIVNEMDLISINNSNLVAVLIKNNVNVKQYGAKGDNIKNDTNSIQTCINNNSRVFFPEGNYLIDNLIIPSGRYLYGSINDKSKLYITNIKIGTNNDYNYNTFIKNLSFNCNSNNLLELINCYYTIIDSCSFNNSNENINSNGIIINANYNVNYFIKILNCVFSNFNKAVTILDGANANSIANSTFYNCDICIEIDNSNSISINNNAFQDFKSKAINILNSNEQSYSIGISIFENYIEGIENNLICGIYIDNNLVRNTQLISNKYFGLVPTYPEIIDNGRSTYRLEFTGGDPGKDVSIIPSFLKVNPKPNTYKTYNGITQYGSVQIFDSDNEKGELFVNNRIYNNSENKYEYSWEQIPTFRNNITNFAGKQINGGGYLPTSISMFYNNEIKLGNGDKQGQGNMFFDTNRNTLKISDGTSFNFYQKVYANTSSNRLNLPTTGMMMFDTTLNKPIWWNGTNWVDYNGNNV